MSSHSHAPSSRVHEILQRMQENVAHVDSLKTCCGVLAILSRDEANKLLIARDGIRLLTSVMNTHITNPGLQEAACDLIWSLAFNNNLVKEVIGRQGGIPVIIKGMRVHANSADLLKSSCGALSNMCQNTHNQSLIAAHGGISCILEALRRHKSNAALLPFIFDALASLIVGNERNAREVSETGAISLILESIGEHGGKGELVKSGCHALAILSDSQGQGAKISAADGVKVLLPTLRAHPNHLDLHRVAAVVLLRMLQESPVAREIAERGGVPLMLCVLKEQQHEVETIAAACHILYSITHPDAVGNSKHPVDIESQLIMPPVYDSKGNILTDSKDDNANKEGPKSTTPTAGGGVGGGLKSRSTINNLSAIISVIEKHDQRKDIVRACVRSMVNLSRFRALLAWIDASESVGPILAAAALHSQARDITDSCATLLKGLNRRVRGRPGARLSVIGTGQRSISKAVSGLLCCLKARPNDMELVAGIFASLTNALVAIIKARQGAAGKTSDERIDSDWERDASRVTLVWASMLVRELPQSKKRDEVRNLVVGGISATIVKKGSNGAGLKGDGGGVGAFWTQDRTGSVLQMARFLRTLVQMRNGDAVGESANPRSARSNFFSSSNGVTGGGSMGTLGNGKSSGANVLDVCSAKDIVTSLFESLPVPPGKEAPGEDGGDGEKERERKRRGSTGSMVNASLSTDLHHLEEVWYEMESLLNCLIPATQEAEMNEAAEQALRNVQVKVTQPPPPVSALKSDIDSVLVGEREHEREKGMQHGDEDGSSGAQQNGGAASSSSAVDAKGGSGVPGMMGKKTAKLKTSSSAASLKNERGERERRNTSPSRTKQKKSQKRGGKASKNAATDYVQGNIKCTCSHGSMPHLQSRSVPVHPLHDPELNVKQLHQFPPNELEMIQVGRGEVGGRRGGDGCDGEGSLAGGCPEKTLLCYRSCSAAGLSVQSREPIKLPYNIPGADSQEAFPHSLSFESCFESGNLYQAVQVGPTEYDLFIRPDLHSVAGHMQWFYFAVGNTHTASQIKSRLDNPGMSCVSRVKFNLVNLLKNDSLFNQGMRPVMYSKRDSLDEEKPKGWVR